MKLLSKVVFALYLIGLSWLILFKFSSDIFGVLDIQLQSLNLIPFADSYSHPRELIDNFLIFIPFGLLLSVTSKNLTLWQKLLFISAFSATVETIQFIVAIGVTDITDFITNSLGGLCGLALYDLANKQFDTKRQDLFIVIGGIILLTLLLALRFFVFRIRY